MMVMMVWTWRTGPANPAHGRQALVMCLETAIAGTAPHIVMGTPVRLSGPFNEDDSCDRARDD